MLEKLKEKKKLIILLLIIIIVIVIAGLVGSGLKKPNDIKSEETKNKQENIVENNINFVDTINFTTTEDGKKKIGVQELQMIKKFNT